DGRSFLWLSERDGKRHLYRVRREEHGEAPPPMLITKFDAEVTDFVGVDDKAGLVFFLASPDSATQRYLYRAPLDGSSAPVRVTPAGNEGWHTYTPAPGAKLAFHTYSSFDRVPVMDVISLPDHRSLRALTDPSALQAKLADLLRPASFEPSKTYPVSVQVYGEPASQTVTDRWNGNGALFHRALADAGYLVV